MNKVEMLGRMTKDPEVRYSQGGAAVANFSIAVDRRFKREGEPTADFFNCVAFSKTAEFVEKYFSKGSGICIVGRLQNDEYEKDGKKVIATKIYVDEVYFGGGNKNGQNGGQNASQAQPQPKPDADGFFQIPDNIDDMLPFE